MSFSIEVIFTIIIIHRLITSQSQQLCYELYKCAVSPQFNKHYGITTNTLYHSLYFIFDSEKMCIYVDVYTYCPSLLNIFIVIIIIIIIIIIMHTTILYFVPYSYAYLCNQVPYFAKLLYLPDILVILSAMLTSLNPFLHTNSNILLSDPNIDVTIFKQIFRLASFLSKQNLHAKALKQSQSNINLIDIVQLFLLCDILMPIKLNLFQAFMYVHCNSVCQNLQITNSLCVVQFSSLHQNKIYYVW